jgi:hypothetical protein
MNIHCPNCQKELMIPDQYAGQQMKCPLCQGNFMAPSLSASEGVASPPASVPSPAPPPDTFALQPPAPPPGPPPPPVPADLESDMPPRQSRRDRSAPPPPPQPDVPRPTEYKNKVAIYLSPDVIQWIVLGAMVLIFALSFFPWVGYGFGGVNLATQNAWGAAFGSYSVDSRLADEGGPIPTDSESDKPGINLILIFYLIFFVVIAFLVVLAATLIGILPLALPPAIQNLLPLRWAVAGGFCLLGFLLLSLQLLFGFSFEHKLSASVNETIEKKDRMYREMRENLPEEKKSQIQFTDQEKTLFRGQVWAGAFRAFPLTMTFWLHLIAAAGGVYLFWINLQKTQPIPKIEIHT